MGELDKLDLRLFRSDGRKVLDAVDRALDIVEDGVGIGEGGHLDYDRAKALARGRHHALDTRQPDDAFLDAAVDVRFDLLRRCAGVEHGNSGPPGFDVGVVLDDELKSRQHPAHDQQDHQQMGGDGIAREVGDQSRLEAGRARLCRGLGVGAAGVGHAHRLAPLFRRLRIAGLDGQSLSRPRQGADDHAVARVERLHHHAAIGVSQRPGLNGL